MLFKLKGIDAVDWEQTQGTMAADPHYTWG